MNTDQLSENSYKVLPESEWHEDIGPVIWWHLDEYGAISETPIIACGGEDLANQQPWDNYYTHWSRLPTMEQYPVRELMLAPTGILICDKEWDDASYI